MNRVIEREGIVRFRDTVVRRLGLLFDDGKLDHLTEIVSARLDTRHIRDVGSYVDYLDSAGGRDELRVLADLLTVAETYFFRYADHFRAFAELVLPDRSQTQGPLRPVRVLSAGCASGEEPYSLRILASEHRGPDGVAPDVQIHAVDVSPAAIARARRARYSTWSLRGTPPEVQERYFQVDGSGFSLKRHIREAVTFAERNLVDDDAAFWRPAAFDVVFLRNVIMYLAPEVARAVIARITGSMAPGGFLFLGHAETLRGISHEFHLRHTHDTFYYQRREDAMPGLAQRSLEPAGSSAAAELPSDLIELDASWVDAIRGASQRITALAAQSRESESPVASGPPSAKPGPSLDLSRALELVRQERFSDAMEVLRAVPPDSSGNPDTLLLQAVIFTNAGTLREAEKVCRALLMIDDLNAGAHYLMALCREHDKDLPGALSHDQTAVYLDPAFAMPHLHWGLMARRAGDDLTARRHLAEAADLLTREDPSRVLLFGGGFSREALVELCRSALQSCGAPR